ncbi:MAG: hypothetical protein CVV61_04385 [Tenericutes bacterium HGW-Tenericutes-6]|jgi:PDZ domain-containing protein|nr:MAG: hypothetical protein CVV61_04385 [Tenericutes bacterium HGW-Tenericutes-6]
MLTLIKQYKKILVVLFFPYIYLLFMLVAPTDLSVTAPGDITPVESWIDINGVTFNHQFHTVYVYSYHPITAFQNIILSQDDRMNVYETNSYEKDTTWREDYLSGQIAKKSSLIASLIVAYEKASEIDSTISIDYKYEGLYIRYRPSRIKALEIGDEIIEIDGFKAENFSHQSFLERAYQGNPTYKVRREVSGEYITFDYTYQREPNENFILFYPNYSIIDATPSFELPGLDGFIGGPSGGLLQSLSIYVSLLKLNIEPLIFAGTGTIEVGGNVGRIGGIQQKLYTAIDQKVDVFLMPKSHQNDIKDMDYPFKLLIVEDFNEAVEMLNDYINE